MVVQREEMNSSSTILDPFLGLGVGWAIKATLRIPSIIDYWLLRNFNLTTPEKVAWILSFSQLETLSPWCTDVWPGFSKKCWPWNLNDTGPPGKPTWAPPGWQMSGSLCHWVWVLAFLELSVVFFLKTPTHTKMIFSLPSSHIKQASIYRCIDNFPNVKTNKCSPHTHPQVTDPNWII